MFEIIHFGMPQSLQLASSTLTCHIYFSMPQPLQQATSTLTCHIHFSIPQSLQHASSTLTCHIHFRVQEAITYLHQFLMQHLTTYPHPLQQPHPFLLTYHIHLSMQHLNSIQIPLSIATEKLSLCLCNLMV